ncbi:hypothetical protein MML48_1g08827 [Holotrichia oblita]|uniref:Uncharacterized protein n=1 Tax=Holotrichia oblita TaxID=644536 RepID=A0ACB9TU55_HOLOL|nr:hypothetical protein MML48_1g08827 [Holotrichia oblita]
MEDSTEQYIQISQNPGNENSNNSCKISNEILATAQRKKECEDYAMKIVMFLLDGKLQPEVFLKCLKYINQEYYQDVVEERALSKLCGYPTCGKKIPEMPKQKYFISTKVNKVYDISERKNYCSNFCYQGSLFVKDQIDSSPLWLRNHKEIADCKLMSATLVCTPGKEIDNGLVKLAPDPPEFTSIIQFTQLSLDEVEKTEKASKDSKCNRKFRKTQKLPSLNVIKENTLDTSGSESKKTDYEIEECDDEFDKDKLQDETAQSKFIDFKEKLTNKGCSKTSKILSKEEKLKDLIAKLKVTNESKTKLIDPAPMKIDNKKHELVDNKNITLQQKPNVKSKEDSVLTNSENISSSVNKELLNNIRNCFEEWITLDSFIYLYGEEKIKEILSENKMEQYFDKLNVSNLQVPQQLKYMNICRRLHMQELAEERFHNDTIGYTLKPLPNFKELKEEVQELDLKVKSFYKGMLYEQADANFPTKPVKENQNKSEELTAIPVVDASAQNIKYKIHNYSNSIGGNEICEYYTLILSKYTSIEETMEEIFMLFKYVDKFVESHITQE